MKIKYILQHTNGEIATKALNIEEIEEYGHVIETILSDLPCKGGCVEGDNPDNLCYCYDNWANNCEIVARLRETGLKDMNGKDIFEGDIVVQDNQEYIIEFDSRMEVFHARRPWTLDKELFTFGIFSTKCKLTGSIYDN